MLCMHVYYNAETDRIIIYCDREQIRYEGTEVDLLYCKCCCSRKVRFKFLFTGNVLEKLPFILGFLCQIINVKLQLKGMFILVSCLSISSLFYKEFRCKNGMEMTQSTVILKI